MLGILDRKEGSEPTIKTQELKRSKTKNAIRLEKGYTPKASTRSGQEEGEGGGEKFSTTTP